MIEQPLIETNIPGLKLFHRGKVRDTYEFEDMLLVIATDRISAFDVVLPTGIPEKGKILTRMTEYWLDLIGKGLEIPHHLISSNMKNFPEQVQQYKEADLTGRVMLVRKLKIIPVECIVRGYIVGSLWKEYRGRLNDAEIDSFTEVPLLGYKFPLNLLESQKLEEPIFTPSTKAEEGKHDEGGAGVTVVKFN